MPVFRSSASSSRCTSGISRSVRLLHSPLMSALSPIAQTITLSLICNLQRFCLHLSLVAPVDSLSEFAVLLHLSSRQILHPCAYNKVAFPASACSIASLMVVYLRWFLSHAPCAGYVVSGCRQADQSGLSFPSFFSGRIQPSFFRSTKVSAATSRAA